MRYFLSSFFLIYVMEENKKIVRVGLVLSEGPAGWASFVISVTVRVSDFPFITKTTTDTTVVTFFTGRISLVGNAYGRRPVKITKKVFLKILTREKNYHCFYPSSLETDAMGGVEADTVGGSKIIYSTFELSPSSKIDREIIEELNGNIAVSRIYTGE